MFLLHSDLDVFRQGFMWQARRREDMFSQRDISAIFGNLDSLLAFQSHFVELLRSNVDQDRLHESRIGRCFTDNVSVAAMTTSSVRDALKYARVYHFFLVSFQEK